MKKKVISVFGFPSHQEKTRTHGVDFVRIIQPLKHLNGYSDGEVEFKTTVFDINRKTKWDKVAKEYDIIYFNYINNTWGYAAMGAMARHFGCKLVMELDDALWHVRADNPSYEVWKKGSESIYNFNCIANDVDAMTTTNSYLRHVIMNNVKKSGDKIGVFPNCIDFDLYKHRAPFKDTGQIMLTWFGSTTHFQDLLDSEFVKGVDRVMKEYPNVKFQTIGAFMPQFKEKWGVRYEHPFGHEDIYKWITEPDKFSKFMKETDIMVTPLEEDIYNKSKSCIKYSEVSSAGVPGVYQDIRQYRNIITDGVNGFLAKNDSDWYNKIKKLIDNKELRRSMGQKTFENVKENRDIKDIIPKYAEFFKSLLTNEN